MCVLCTRMFVCVCILVCGLACVFTQADLVVHNVTTGRTVLRVMCGGAHRSWDFAISSKARIVDLCLRQKRT